jgi:hypothetical protein
MRASETPAVSPIAIATRTSIIATTTTTPTTSSALPATFTTTLEKNVVRASTSPSTRLISAPGVCSPCQASSWART